MTRKAGRRARLRRRAASGAPRAAPRDIDWIHPRPPQSARGRHPPSRASPALGAPIGCPLLRRPLHFYGIPNGGTPSFSTQECERGASSGGGSRGPRVRATRGLGGCNAERARGPVCPLVGGALEAWKGAGRSNERRRSTVPHADQRHRRRSRRVAIHGCCPDLSLVSVLDRRSWANCVRRFFLRALSCPGVLPSLRAVRAARDVSVTCTARDAPTMKSLRRARVAGGADRTLVLSTRRASGEAGPWRVR
jgi:hypothetical protein